MRKNIRNRLLIAFFSLSTLLLTSCTGNINNVLSGFQSTVSRRVDWNIEQLGRLKSVGLITDNMYNSLSSNMKSRLLDLTSTDETNLKGNIKNLIEPALAYVVNTKASPFNGITSANLESMPMFKNYVENIGGIATLLRSNRGNPPVESTNVKPLEILSSKDEASGSGETKLNQVLKAKVYVLNSDLAGTDLSDIAIAMHTIKELKDKNGLTEEEKDKLSKARGYLAYFKETDVSLLGDNESLTRVTSPNTDAYNIATGYKIPSSNSNEALNKPENGKDLVIFSDSVPVIGIRLREIDSSVIDKLLKDINDSKDSFIIDYPDGNPANGARIYRMVYPVSYIDSISLADNKASFTVKKSDYMQVNIMTGKAILSKESKTYKPDELNSLEQLYNILGNSDNESSFTIWNKVKTTENHNNKNIEVESNSILLKDYLEYVYLPNFIKGELFVALGRKIRFYGINSDNTFKDVSVIGKFIDKLGSPISGAGYLTIGDILDKNSGIKENLKTAVKLHTGESSTSNTTVSSNTANTYTGGNWKQEHGSWKYTTSLGNSRNDGWYWIDGNNDGTAESYYFKNSLLVANTTVDGYKINADGQWVNDSGTVQTKKLDSNSSSSNTSSTGLVSDTVKNKFESKTFKSTINPIVEFPINQGDNVVAGEDGKSNGTENSKLIHYGIYLDTNLYKSQMYSGWLNIDGDGSGGSLNWWNNWLSKAKFSYSIDKRALSDYLDMNFSADGVKTKDDTIVLDRNTIGDIQDSIDKDRRVGFVTLFRTLFVGLGFVTFIYGFLLLSAWVIDTSTMLNTKFLNILTLGKCIAVIEKTEGLSYGDVVPLTFSGIILRIISLVGLGIILINADFLGIVGKIYGALSGLVQFIAKGIFGV